MSLKHFALIGLGLAWFGFASEAAYLNHAPRREQAHTLRAETLPRVEAPIQQFSIDTRSRQAVTEFFQENYPKSANVASGWKGDIANCNAGATTVEYKNAVLLRVNFFRALAGVPAWISFDSVYSDQNQQAALMMSANGALSHSPPPTWLCYGNIGANAAASSNLAIGAAGAEAIDLYMEDSGANNRDVGHRRWILYPQTQVMGTGDVTPATDYPEANSLWVFDNHFADTRPRTRDDFVAWPPAGYIPYSLVYRRWSFTWPNADFSDASVRMERDGETIGITLEPLATGFGENTLAWRPELGFDANGAFPAPEQDARYGVTLDHVVIDGAERSFSYEVVVFDPSRKDLSQYSCAGRTATLVGTPGDDVLEGTEGNDVILGLGGDDEILGNGGKDVLCGNGGNDHIVGGDGRDRLYGGAGADTLEGGEDDDRLYGGSGKDSLSGENGDDLLKGNAGRDMLDGGDGTDKLKGGGGLDSCFGGETLRSCEIQGEP